MAMSDVHVLSNGRGGLVPLPAAWECDLRNDGLTWSPGVFDLFGIPWGERPRRCEVVQLYTPESRDELEFLRSRAIESGGSFTFEAWINRRADGDARRIRISADTVVRDGRAVLLYGQKFDITHEQLGRVG